MENIYKLKNPDSLMLYNAMYFRKSASNPKPHLDIVYRDLATGKVHLKSIENPKMKGYVVKPEYRNYDYNKAYARKEEVDEYEFDYAKITTEAAKVLDDDALNTYVQGCFDTRSYDALKNVHKHKYLFATDYDIEDYTFMQWHLNYHNDIKKPVECLFMDIETDIYKIEGFPKGGNCPIDLVTIVDPVNMISHTFMLKMKDNPLIEELLSDMDNFRNELSEAFDETYGKMEYKFYPYEEEEEDVLLVDLFKLINYLKRPFVFIWNMSFDIPFIIDRMKILGLDPAEVICHDDFKTKIAYFYKDERHFDRANSGDSFKCSSYSKYLCQLNSYAAIRKGGHAIPSFKLNAIGMREVGDEKLDYHEESDLKNLSRKNYRKYVMYNIKDVLLQYGINSRSHDAEYIYHAATTTFTRYDKVFKQTVFLRNVAYIEYLKRGLIIKNNTNIDYESHYNEDIGNEEEDEGVDGALVTNPLNNGHHGVMINGLKSKSIFDFVIDMDFSSMYPNIIITFNVADCTMVGKLIIDESAKDYYEKHDIDIDGFDAGKDFMENYLTGDILSLGSKWFELPTVFELDQELKDLYM